MCKIEPKPREVPMKPPVGLVPAEAELKQLPRTRFAVVAVSLGPAGVKPTEAKSLPSGSSRRRRN